MKRFLTLMLTAALALSLAACGGEKSENSVETDSSNTSQFDIENAVAETPKHIFHDVMENQARAMQNTYLMSCTVGDITDTYFSCRDLRIYLPVETLAQLNRDDEIGIIGKITEVNTETSMGIESTYVIFGEAEVYDGEVPEVTPRDYEIFTGVVKGKNESYDGAWNISIGGNPYMDLIYFADGQDTSPLDETSTYNGLPIVFTADTRTGSLLDTEYIDAKIIEIVEE